jgi:hypothetical protein
MVSAGDAWVALQAKDLRYFIPCFGRPLHITRLHNDFIKFSVKIKQKLKIFTFNSLFLLWTKSLAPVANSSSSPESIFESSTTLQGKIQIMT